VFITHIDVSVEQEKPVESVQMNFTKVEMVFSGADTSNISGSPKRFEYELKQPASTPTPTPTPAH
jgi:type VI protein secretion system component Hcp